MRDLLREAPFYQEIWEEGHKAGLKEGRQATQRYLQALRETLLQFVEARFPTRQMRHLAKGQLALTDDPKVLQDLILKVGLAQTAEEAQDHLLDWPDPQEIQIKEG